MNSSLSSAGWRHGDFYMNSAQPLS
uniref:Uncharacterized protein n=1 Tax=Arundo donax TaxID=35708 RepID=A0A0A9HP90_ARUDO